MKRILLAATLVTAIAAGGVVAAQTAGPSADEHAAHHPGGKAPATAQANDTQGGGMMGAGMMGGGMMGGAMCPMMGGGGMMMGGAKTKVDVKKIEKGVAITLTSPDAATATRLQKMAEAMRLMHEATAP